MWKVAAVLLLTLLATSRPVFAQGEDQATTHRVVKVLIGASAIAVGATVAAKSGQTTTVTSPLGTTETSSFSTPQLVTGLAIAGVGGFLLWDGLRHHEPHVPSSTLSIAAGKGTAGILWHRSW